MITWRELITAEMEKNGETYVDIVFAKSGENYRHKIYKNKSPEELEELKKKYPILADNIPPDASAEQWDTIEFYEGHGGENGMPFVVYTENWIYFSMTYDGREFVDCIPRTPNSDWQPKHFGG